MAALKIKPLKNVLKMQMNLSQRNLAKKCILERPMFETFRSTKAMMEWCRECE